MLAKLLTTCVATLGAISLSACTANADSPEKIYKNNHVEHVDKNFFSFLRMRYFGDDEWADHETEAKSIPVIDVDFDLIQQPLTPKQVTWIGHSTFLIQLHGVNVLTDPVFSERASPLSFVGPKRLVRLPVSMAQLPPIDIVVISHNHYDHLDEWTIKQLGNNPTYYVPQGLKEWFVEQGIAEEKVVQLKWWQSLQDSTGVKISALPSQHWSARGLYDRHKTHWASWLLEFKEYKTWFAGDTGYNEYDFKKIGEEVGGVNLALIPIGAWAPRHFMQTYHVNEAEAYEIHKDIKSELSIGMHWGTFPLTAEGPKVPQNNLQKLTTENNDYSFITMTHGETKPLLQR